MDARRAGDAMNKLNWSRSASVILAGFTLLLSAGAGAQRENLVTKNYKSQWTRIAIPPAHPVSDIAQWHIDPAAKTVVCDGNGGHEWLRFNQEFSDFKLHVEWRFTKLDGDAHYNSGVFFRNDSDGTIWHQAQTSPEGGYLFGETMLNGKKTSFNLMKEMTENRIHPAGDWNTYDIECRKGTCTLSVNGAVVNTLHT